MKYEEVEYIDATHCVCVAQCEFDKNGKVLSYFAMTYKTAKEIAVEFSTKTEWSNGIAPRFGGDFAYTSL